jgi:pimeloyl-ACP methyl ester carboxylesterase
MLTFLRWLGRALFVLFVLVLLACCLEAMRFERWKERKLADLDKGSTVIQTAAGPIEYAESGKGPAVLICHGAPGGYDQALLLGGYLAKEGFRVIAPSRPGFLRTPLTSGMLFDEQADALAGLLDKLGIQTASVVGFSTGAQVAARFAIRHPDRTTALVLISPVTKQYACNPKTQSPLLAEAALSGATGDMGSWLFVEQAKRDPRWMLNAVLAVDTTLKPAERGKIVDYVLSHPEQLEFFRGLIETQAPLSPRETGTRNDLLLVRALDAVSYEKILSPILIVRGDADAGGAWVNPGIITEKAPSAQTLLVKGAGHLVWFGPGADAAQQAILNFLTHPPAMPTPAPSPSAAPVAPPAPTPTPTAP